MPASAPPAVGDTFDNTGIDYVGNHKHHAAKPDGSDHLRCTITSISSTGPTVLCSGQIAIGGSMLLANRRDVHAVGQPSPDSDQRRHRNLPARARPDHPDQHR